MNKKKEQGVYDIAVGNNADFLQYGEESAKQMNDFVNEFWDENEERLKRIIKESKADGNHSKLTKHLVKQVVMNALFYEVGDILWKRGYDVSWD